MADKRISELTAADPLDGSERIPLEQGGVTKSIDSGTYVSAFTMAASGWYAPTPKTLTTHSHGEGVLTVTTLLVPRPTDFDRIACEVTTAGETDSVIRLGVYADNGGPGSLLFDAGTVLADTTGVKEITISQSLSGQLVWVAAVAQNCPTTAPTLRAITNSATRPNYLPANDFNSGRPGIVETGVTGSLPDPWSGFNLTNTANVYLVEARAV